jgi:WhiB family redox-sensing transcriptional regulator
MLSSDAASGPFGWMSRGACRSEDPELFFPVTTQGAALRQVSADKAVCRACAVRAVCLSFGLQTSQDGIWGGTTVAAGPLNYAGVNPTVSCRA